MITTNRFIRGGTNEVIEKPSVVVGYTKSMGGVDRADQYASSYCFLRKSLVMAETVLLGNGDINN